MPSPSTVPSLLPMKDLERGCEQVREDISSALSTFEVATNKASGRDGYDAALDALHKELDGILRDIVHVRHGRSRNHGIRHHALGGEYPVRTR